MQLSHAYILRKKWEAELQAGLMVRALNQAMGESPSTGSGDGGAGRSDERMSADEILRMMGMN